jgi:two-component sensor histidine kinase
MRRLWLTVAIIGAAGGVAADLWAFDAGQPLLWAPDLAVGLVLLAAGASSVARRRHAGVLLIATGLTWFAGTVAPEAAYWHRGVLVHLLVSFPDGRPASRTGWLLVGAGYPAAAVPPIWHGEVSTVALGGLAAGVSVAGLWQARVRGRRSRRIASGIGAGLSAVVVLGAVARLTLPPGSAGLPSLLAYEVALVVAAGFLWAGLRPVGVTAVTDLVVDLGSNRSAPLRAALADLIGDPSARLGYWQASRAAYVDDAGDVLTEPAARSGRTLTRIDRDGRPFAALLHDSAVGAGATVAEAVAAAGRLMSAHAGLQDGIRVRVAEVTASRRRLQQAVDGERHRLERRLSTVAEAPMLEMSDVLDRISQRGDAHVARARDQLGRTLLDLHDAARGLYPHELAGGLAPALSALSGRCPVAVELTAPDERFGPEIEVAVYYLCAEALTNVVKHSAASTVRIAVVVHPAALVVTVTDDGAGGAAVTAGTGLIGLRDRVESVGGTMRVQSRPGAGTTLAAEFPLGGRPR